MNFLKYIEYLFLIYGISFHLVVGQTNNEGKSDCTILYNFLNGDTEDYGNSCCSEDNIFIDCDDEGYITSFINAADEVIDIPSFPRLSRMENLSFVGLSIKEIPDNIFKFTTLKRLNFYINKIEVIPPAIQNLSNLEEIILDENNIKEIPNEIFTLKNLKSLDLGKNNIEVIPPAIQKLSKLEELYFHHNNIKEIPNELFQLKNLRSIYMNDNPISDAKIIKFGDKSLVYCDLSKINISCYEPNTCKTILLANSRKINDEIAQKEFKKCTKEEISSIMELTESKAEAESQTESKNNSSQESKINKINKNIVNRNDKIPNFPSIIKSVIVLGGIIVAFIGIIGVLTLIKKNKFKKRKRSYINLDDESQTEKYIKNNENYNSNTINRIINDTYNVNPNNSIMVNLNDMIKDIHRGGSYSSYSSYGFSSFSLQ